jgi:hypothetical protein
MELALKKKIFIDVEMQSRNHIKNLNRNFLKLFLGWKLIKIIIDLLSIIYYCLYKKCKICNIIQYLY